MLKKLKAFNQHENMCSKIVITTIMRLILRDKENSESFSAKELIWIYLHKNKNI